MPRYRLTYDQGSRVIPHWFDAKNSDEARGFWRGFKAAHGGQRLRLYDAKGHRLEGPPEQGTVSTTASRPGVLTLEDA